MKISLALLIVAALLSWASLRLESLNSDPGVISAERHGGPPQPATPFEVPVQPAPDTTSPVTTPAAAPLFRPAAAPPEIDQQPGQSFALIGVAASGDQRVALIRDNVDQQSFRIRAGEEVRGWTVARVEARCALLRRAQVEVNLCVS